MFPAQCRAARAILQMGQRDLARVTGLTVGTIADFELGKRQPYPATIQLLRLTFEKLGVTFIDGQQIGVSVAAPAAAEEGS